MAHLKRLALCFFRVSQCSECAAVSLSVADRNFHLGRERAWLALARRCAVRWGAEQAVQQTCFAVPMAPNCPACNLKMVYQSSEPVRRIFLPPTLASMAAFFLCPNCAGLVEQLIVEC